ncbi:hypothetical protein BGW38_000319 [Lunasporangiospora selenospora]|uniref:Uncharacterized protein n=1 Tax=Lunasporangiospora selenospora TaxID=979761 RepID=A0A9P6FWA9_9FUNG|nr:hypothetical protein BGW38_000319 [Lunasporangiospora selenospora]
MDIKIVSAITRLANYMPLGSYVIYTALETYSFSLGAAPTPVKTIVQTPGGNYTCYYSPGAGFTFTTCTTDQHSALIVSLAIGFFLAVFLSFLKQVPKNGTPPLAQNKVCDHPELGSPARLVKTDTVDSGAPTQSTGRRKYRRGVIYAEGNIYYVDFGDFHIWGHALLSFVAFGTLSLFSASVSQCLFPGVKPWIFVFTQVILLVVCCFIAMFWINDPSLSIGLTVVSPTETRGAQTPGPGMNINNAATSTTSVPATVNQAAAAAAMASMASNTTMSSEDLANEAMSNNVINSIFAGMQTLTPPPPSSVWSGRSAVTLGPGGIGTSRLSLGSKRTPTMSSVNEKEGLSEEDTEVNVLRDDPRVAAGVGASAPISTATRSSTSNHSSPTFGHVSVQVDRPSNAM